MSKLTWRLNRIARSYECRRQKLGVWKIIIVYESENKNLRSFPPGNQYILFTILHFNEMLSQGQHGAFSELVVKYRWTWGERLGGGITPIFTYPIIWKSSGCLLVSINSKFVWKSLSEGAAAKDLIVTAWWVWVTKFVFIQVPLF